MAIEFPEVAAVKSVAGLNLAASPDRTSDRYRALRESADIWVPGGLLALIVLACFVWPLVYPLRSPTLGLLQYSMLLPLSPHYLLGSDPIGRDIVSRILYGGRISLEVGFGATGIGLVLGSLLGILAGYWGGIREMVIMRILDMLLAFPALVLAIVIANYLGPSEIHVIWAIAFFSIPSFARLARAQTLRVREQIYIVAARLSGTRDRGILLRHIAPNVLSQLMTYACLGVAVAIIVEAALSFLGLGVPQPHPSWGNMIALGEQYLAIDPYLVLIPSGCLFITVMSLNLLGDALRVRWGER